MQLRSIMYSLHGVLIEFGNMTGSSQAVVSRIIAPSHMHAALQLRANSAALTASGKGAETSRMAQVPDQRAGRERPS